MAKPNAYVVFVREVSRKRQQQTGQPVNFQALFQELDQTWRNMSEEDKHKYKEMAKNAAKKDLSANYYSDDKKLEGNQPGSKRGHEDDSETDHTQRLKINLPKLPQATIGEDARRYGDYRLYILRNRCQEIVESRGDELLTTPLYACSVNVLSRHEEGKEAIYTPIEIGIHGYSIDTGRIGKSFHAIIDAGPVQKNCLSLAIEHKNAHHKIDFPTNVPNTSYPKEARNDYKKLYKEILSYASPGERTLLTYDMNHLDQVEGCLNWLHKKASESTGAKLPKNWTILPITEFVHATHNYFFAKLRIGPIEQNFGFSYYIRSRLATSHFDYNESLMCSYHEKSENITSDCALSCAIRMINNIDVILEDIHRIATITTSNRIPTGDTALPIAQKQQQPTAAVAYKLHQLSIEGSCVRQQLISAALENRQLCIEGPPAPTVTIPYDQLSLTIADDPRIRRSQVC